MSTTPTILRKLLVAAEEMHLSERITWAGWMYCPFWHLRPYVDPYPRREHR